jgi:hypothetical protein
VICNWQLKGDEAREKKRLALLKDAVDRAKMDHHAKKAPAKVATKRYQPPPFRQTMALNFDEHREWRLFKEAIDTSNSDLLTPELMAKFKESLSTFNDHKLVKAFVRSKMPTLGNGRILPKASARFLKHKRYFSRVFVDVS